jgi:ribosomal-protein-alanine N-acetyltransferase
MKYDIKSGLTAEEDQFHTQQWEVQDAQYVGAELAEKYGGTDDTSWFSVASEEGRIVGIAELRITNGVGKIHSVIVQPAHRGKGVGRRLFEDLLTKAQAEQLVYVYLETREEWAEAVQLYESCGFEITQHLPVYYFGLPWIRMGKTL